MDSPAAGKWRRVADFNVGIAGPGDRALIDIMAPGTNLFVDGLDDTVAMRNGTSYAAPHVTGTVALLQEHAENQIMAGAAGWDEDARRHEVMKAVLINSADKIEDDDTLAPVGSFLGMERTVLDTEDENWLNSTAAISDMVPMDVEMGAGHLNAKRALQQFSPGESPVGDVVSGQSANAPHIGWDYNDASLISEDINKYLIQGDLVQDSFVSVTLAWDRQVLLDFDTGTVGEYDPGDDFEAFFPDSLDLHVVPAGTMSLDTATWKASSTSEDTTLEHIFAEIPSTGEYEIWVENTDEFFDAGPYALAWWSWDGTAVDTPGDYDGNGSIGPEDYDLWRSQFGATVTAGMGPDGSGDGIVSAADYVVWRDNLGAGGSSSMSAVPEPEPLTALLVVITSLSTRRIQRRRIYVVLLSHRLTNAIRYAA